LAKRLLDTNIVSALMRGDYAAQEHLAALAQDEKCSLSVVVNGEVLYGLERMQSGRRKSALEKAYTTLAPAFGAMLGVDEDVSAAYAHWKAVLTMKGANLPENDLWIAATALVHRLTLVTHDEHFHKVPGLAIEDWLD